MQQFNAKIITVWSVRAIAFVLYAFVVISQIILIQGFFLKLFGANPSSDYVQWAYRSLDRVMEPFRGMFTPIEIDGNAILDPSILFAMIIYGIVAMLMRIGREWLTYRLDKAERDRELELAQIPAIAPDDARIATAAPTATPPQ